MVIMVMANVTIKVFNAVKSTKAIKAIKDIVAVAMARVKAVKAMVKATKNSGKTHHNSTSDKTQLNITQLTLDLFS